MACFVYMRRYADNHLWDGGNECIRCGLDKATVRREAREDREADLKIIRKFNDDEEK